MQRLRSVRAAWQSVPAWKVYAASTAALLAAGLSSSLYAERRLAAEREESREFPPTSATEQIANALDTGDVLLFNRHLWDGRPLRSAYILLSKYLNGEYDHAGVIIKNREHDLPYLLEYTLRGMQLLPFDSRLLHSRSHEVILRHVDCPRSPDRLDRVDDLLAYHRRHLPQAAASSSSLTSSLVASAKQMGRMLLGCFTRGASGGAEGVLVRDVGEYAQLVQEMDRTRGRIAAVDADLSEQVEEEGQKRLQGKRKRLTTSMQRLVKREVELRKTLTSATMPLLPPPGSALGSLSTAQPSAASPAALIVDSPSASTALVVQVLQALSALSVSAADQATFDAAAAEAECSPSPSASCDVTEAFPVIPPSPPLIFPYPPTSYYLTKHFLSQTQLPLHPNSVLERELFVKTKGKTLQYNIIGA